VPGRGARAPDLLVVLEDLELANKQTPEVVVQVFREATAKHVEHLRDPSEKKCSRYRETHEGKQALELLDWMAALRSPAHCTFLRALVEDLAHGLGEMLALPAGGRASPLTSHRERREAPALRNI